MLVFSFVLVVSIDLHHRRKKKLEDIRSQKPPLLALILKLLHFLWLVEVTECCCGVKPECFNGSLLRNTHSERAQAQCEILMWMLGSKQQELGSLHKPTDCLFRFLLRRLCRQRKRSLWQIPAVHWPAYSATLQGGNWKKNVKILWPAGFKHGSQKDSATVCGGKKIN